MGCKFSFKRVFLVASLSLAGLFGISSILVNRQVQENPVMEEAKADSLIPPDYVYVRTTLNVSGQWEPSMMSKIHFYCYDDVGLDDNLLSEAYYGDSLGTTVTQVSTINQYTYARMFVSKDSSLDHFVINNNTGRWNNDTRTGEKTFLELLDTYVIDTRGNGIGGYTSGYWTKQLYVDVSGSSWRNNLSNLEILFETESSYEDMIQTENHCGFSYPNNLAFAEIPKDGNNQIMSEIPEVATIRLKNTSETINIDLERNSNYVYKIVSNNDGSNRRCEIVSIDNYAVTFNNNGRGSSTAEQSVPYGTTAVVTPTPPTATNYTFGGWYKEAECSNPWTFGTDVVRGPVTLFASWSMDDGFYLYGSFNSWSTSDGLIKLTEYETGKYKVDNLVVTANTQLKLGQVNSHSWYHDYGYAGCYSPFPQLYTIEMGDKGGGATTNNFKIVTPGTYTIIVWDLHEESSNDTCRMAILPETQPVVQFTINDGAKQSMNATHYGIDRESQTYKAIYSSTSKINPAKGDIIKYYVNGVLFDSTIPESSGINSISGSAGNLYVHNDLLESQNLIFETTVSNYVAYMAGYREIISSPYTGVYSGTDFYVIDYSYASYGINWWTQFEGVTHYTYIRFYAPKGGYDEDYGWLDFGTTISGGREVSDNTVPQLNGEDVYWTKADLYCCLTHEQPDPNNDSTFYKRVTNVSISADEQNMITIAENSWQALDNVYFGCYEEPTAGFASGKSLYILDSDNWHTTWGTINIYCYFFTDKNADNSGNAWSAAATVVPYSNDTKGATYYEITIPKNGENDALWKSVILVVNSSPAFDYSKKQQSGDINVLTESKSSCQLLTTVSHGSEGGNGTATLTNVFTAQDRSDCFVAHFLDIVNNGICDDYDGYTSNLSDLQDEWEIPEGWQVTDVPTNVRTDFERMDDKARSYFSGQSTTSPSGTPIERATSTYDYVVSKYDLEDFASRDGVTISYSSIRNNYHIFGITNVDDNASIILIIIASSISILSITALSVLLVKKRKSQ